MKLICDCGGLVEKETPLVGFAMLKCPNCPLEFELNVMYDYLGGADKYLKKIIANSNEDNKKWREELEAKRDAWIKKDREEQKIEDEAIRKRKEIKYGL